MKRKLIALAEQNLELCRKLITMRDAYTGRLEICRGCVGNSLSGLLEALSLIFCDLSVLQKGEQPDVDLYRENDRRLSTFTKLDMYLQSCTALLNSSKTHKGILLPYTLMFVKAQTLMLELRGLG